MNIVKSLEVITYEKCLKLFGQFTLQKTRPREDLIMVYNFLLVGSGETWGSNLWCTEEIHIEYQKASLLGRWSSAGTAFPEK